ncbi:MAG TPA: hypothetical protein VFQ45_05465 [Longimicrobium sp.]|nr:hypothetical protein [Longimicrobium sp.]
MRSLRLLLGVLALGLGLGTALGLTTAPLAADTASEVAIEAADPDGFGHIDDMGTYKFCHCGPETECYPCANWPPKTGGTEVAAGD